jgi:L-lactate utilization protein LutC
MNSPSPWAKAWHLNQISSGCTTWRVASVGRLTETMGPRARPVAPAGAGGRRAADERPGPTAGPPASVEAARPVPRRASTEPPLGGFELLNQLDPYDPYDRFDRPAMAAGSTNLDSDDLVCAFACGVEDAGGVCHRVTGYVPDSLLDRLVADLEAWEIVFSGDAEEEEELAQRLRNRGAQVSPATPARATEAVMGITLAVAGIADTGSLVLNTGHRHGRLASLLPPVQLCILPAERLIATPAAFAQVSNDVISPSSASLTVMTGPKQTGMVGRPLTRRTHQPRSLHVIVIEGRT